MRIRTIVLAVVLLVLAFGVGRLSAAGSSAAAGSLEPPGPPESTFSYSLEDIYNRLDTGAAGTQSTFAEPATGPMAGTMHTLNEIMDIAPAIDDTYGATSADVLADKTAWGLTSGGWGLITGTMPNNGAVVITPTTTSQTIAAGYHNGSGYVTGDADLVAGNIKDGVNVFGITGTHVGGSPYPAPVPKTGQTTSYATGDDGDLEMGVAWPAPRFITSTTGIVTDTLTGLIWLQNANCFGTRNWATALTDAATLNSGECGLSDGSIEGDWRLPNVRERQSLIDYGRYNPALPSGHPFTNVQSHYYWSSSSSAYDTSYAWSVSLYGGYVNALGKTNTIYVWPVRGGQ